MPKNDSLNGTTLPLRKIRQRESAVPKHRYGRYQIADIINYILRNRQRSLSTASLAILQTYQVTEESQALVARTHNVNSL